MIKKITSAMSNAIKKVTPNKPAPRPTMPSVVASKTASKLARRGRFGFKDGGGISTSLKEHASAPASKAHAMKKGGAVGASKMGAVKTAAPSKDGVASKGKTKGKMVKMAGGGKC